MERVAHPKITISPDQVADQVRRSRYFLEQARALNDPIESFDNLVASIYFSRAAVELLREAAKLGQLPYPAAEWNAELTRLVPRARLVRLLRIQDFHRTPLSGERRLNLLVKIVAPGESSGEVVIDPDLENPRVQFEGHPDAKAYFLLVSDKRVQTHLEEEPVRIEDLIDEHNTSLEAVLPLFRDLIERQREAIDDAGATS